MGVSRIKRVRELRRLTQRYMAVQLGIAQCTYSRIEAGTITPGRERMRRIAELLDASVDELKGGDLCMAVVDHPPTIGSAITDEASVQRLAQKLSLLIEEYRRMVEADLREREAMRELMKDYLDRRAVND